MPLAHGHQPLAQNPQRQLQTQKQRQNHLWPLAIGLWLKPNPKAKRSRGHLHRATRKNRSRVGDPGGCAPHSSLCLLITKMGPFSSIPPKLLISKSKSTAGKWEEKFFLSGSPAIC